VACPYGKVKNPTPASNAASDLCISACGGTICAIGQVGQGGVCKNCTEPGKVPDANCAYCVACPYGKVKNTGTPASASDLCIPACSACNAGQVGQGGVCIPCSEVGKAPDANCAYCVACPYGKVKFPVASASGGVCVKAECPCLVNQVGQGGVCTDCPANKVPDSNRAYCVYCPSPKVAHGGVCKPAECAAYVPSGLSRSAKRPRTKP
jgi:hypothetical protein